MKNDNDILSKVIHGRIKPCIYAFSTNSIPKYYKIGDTYRPIDLRLNEWKVKFPDLKKEFEHTAMVSDDIFFRDYSVHKYLEDVLNKDHLLREDIDSKIYYSKEFYRDVKEKELRNSIKAIMNDYKNNVGKYQFYSTAQLPQSFTYSRGADWELRPIQQEVVNNFVKAVDSGRKNLLMYAVMRFGKSFTSLSCAVEKNMRLVVVVSGKADVKEEWKKTVEIAGNFKKYKFLTSEELSVEATIITKILNSNEEQNRLVVFLTLQDLQGEKLKSKHKELFSNKIDLLVIDETHFGARAEQFGKVLQEQGFSKSNNDLDDSIAGEEFEECIKVLNADIKLHLSGTPYRILLGSEFEKDDVISFCQFSDIIDEKNKWDEENLYKDEVREWDNPYYGFPQMIRFAFSPNDLSIKKISELRSKGYSTTLSDLLKPKSLKKDELSKHLIFEHKNEVLELMQIIDGKKSSKNILSFLNYDKITKNSMCRHIVIVLPFCTSCDALEKLLQTEKFINLSNYEIINISGVTTKQKYNTIKKIKDSISEFEKNNKKTITLTVNKMLTGTTVEQWDTMIYLKDTSSPQEYDQAIFRLQNQYIKEYRDNNNDVIKYNMKPQTILVDFNVNRVFRMQEQKALIYNANIEKGGNSNLSDRIAKELNISPIIVMNSNKIKLVTPSNILEAISEYSKTRGIYEEVDEVPIDLTLNNNPKFYEFILTENELNSNKGFSFDPTNRDKDDLDVPEENDLEQTGNENKNLPPNAKVDNNDDINEKSIISKFKNYYSRILFYSYLTSDSLTSLSDILDSIEKDENKRIARNIGLKKDILQIVNQCMNKLILNKLDYKIQNINNLSRDTSINPIERMKLSVSKFNKLTFSEIPTPIESCNKLFDLIERSELKSIIKNKKKILNVGGKTGEFEVSLISILHEMKLKIEDVKDLIYTIPTSKLAYEFTLKLFKELNLNVENVFNKFTTEELIKDEKYCEELIEMEFELIIGNPPYMELDGGAQSSSKPIYNNFVDIAKKINPKYLSMIIPTRWFAGGKGLDDFRNSMMNDKQISIIHDYLNPKEIFNDANIRGGVCFFLRDKDYLNDNNNMRLVTHDDGEVVSDVYRNLITIGVDTVIRDYIGIQILDKVKKINKTTLKDHVSSRRPFKIDASYVKSPKFNSEKTTFKNPVICIAKGKREGLIDKSDITINLNWINTWKVYIARANNIGTELNDDNINCFIGKKNTVCTESYIAVGAELNLDKNSAENLCKYLNTKFVRYLHSLAKASQDATSKTFVFVPLEDYTLNSDIDWRKKDNDLELQLFKKYKLTDDEINHILTKIK